MNNIIKSILLILSIIFPFSCVRYITREFIYNSKYIIINSWKLIPDFYAYVGSGLTKQRQEEIYSNYYLKIQLIDTTSNERTIPQYIPNIDSVYLTYEGLKKDTVLLCEKVSEMIFPNENYTNKIFRFNLIKIGNNINRVNIQFQIKFKSNTGEINHIQKINIYMNKINKIQWGPLLD